MNEKIDAGAQFLQTRICMNAELLRHYSQHLVDQKLTQRTSLIGAVAVMSSADDVHWLRKNRPNVKIPPEMLKRLESADDPEAEGIQICAETIRAMQEIPGLDGVNIVAVKDISLIPRVIAASGLQG